MVKKHSVAPATSTSIEEVKALKTLNAFSGKTKATIKGDTLKIETLDNSAEELDQDLAKLGLPTLTELKGGLSNPIEAGVIGGKYSITLAIK